MKINIKDLSKSSPVHMEVDLQEDIGVLEFNGDTLKFLEPVRLTGTITSNNGILRLKGELNLVLELNCHRCSKGFTYKTVISIEECYTNAEKIPDDFYSFNGNEIDLMPMVFDNILTNIPMKILCMQECKGLCGICGSNRNDDDCSCKTQEFDPRFEALLKIKK